MNDDATYQTQLLELRSYKEFAAICQFLHTFHDAFNLKDFDTEELEQAFLNPRSSAYLIDLQSRMLRTLTLNRFISFDTWMEYTRREYVKRLPDENPWNEDEVLVYDTLPLKTKVMIISNLCEWQLDDPERFRQQLKADEELAFEWRVDPIGRDANDRIYWLFDDNRMYRETPPPKASSKAPKPKPKAKAPAPSRPAAPPVRQGTRRSARGQVKEDTPEPQPESEPEFVPPPVVPGVTWEPLCITRKEWEEFPLVFKGSKNHDEKLLYNLITENVLPKILDDFKEKEKELAQVEAIANRKRSSRIVSRELEVQEKERLEAIRQQELRLQAEQRKLELQARREEKERQLQQQIRDNRQKEREMRMKEREQAIRDRDVRKKRQAEKIAKERMARKERRLNGESSIGDLQEDSDLAHEDSDQGIHNDDEEEENWDFDCLCGVHGKNLDDGLLMIACGNCNVWQHVACLQKDDAAKGKAATDWKKADFICPKCTLIVKERKKAERKAAALDPVKIAAKAERARKKAARQLELGIQPKPPKVPKQPKEPKDPNAPKKPRKPKTKTVDQQYPPQGQPQSQPPPNPTSQPYQQHALQAPTYQNHTPIQFIPSDSQQMSNHHGSSNAPMQGYQQQEYHQGYGQHSPQQQQGYYSPPPPPPPMHVPNGHYQSPPPQHPGYGMVSSPSTSYSNSTTLPPMHLPPFQQQFGTPLPHQQHPQLSPQMQHQHQHHPQQQQQHQLSPQHYSTQQSTTPPHAPHAPLAIVQHPPQ